MSGVVVAIVGPSGAGKDSLMRAAARRLAGDPDFVFVRRTVTRASDENEDHDTLTPEAFALAERAGAFALTWGAHGLFYGVPAGVEAEVAAGRIAIANLSRAAIPAMRARFARSRVVLVTASEATLAARLAARGRESGDGRQGRLIRAQSIAISAPPDYIVVNDGPLDESGQRLHAFLMGCAERTQA